MDAILQIIPKNIFSLVSDFKQNNWGDTIEQVIKIEGNNYENRSDTLLHYTGVMLGTLECDVYYSFDYSRLYMGYIELKPIIKDLNEYITLFENIKCSLIESLGPGESNCDWKNERYKYNEAMHSFAIKIGDYSMINQWIFPANNIFLQLNNQETPLSLTLGSMAPKN